ncbi:MAG TPA: cupredoxin domain-containing protein [Stellaceae bacterium]|nr:cupredoxin domain-containing protein [Stellaceae bacterium]
MRFAYLLSAFLGLAAVPALADEPVVTIAIKNHQFVPQDVPIPAGVKVKLLIRNEDPTTSEFESLSLNREKVVVAGSQITIFVGPLDAGSYEFFDDFHPQTRGHLVVK